MILMTDRFNCLHFLDVIMPQEYSYKVWEQSDNSNIDIQTHPKGAKLHL